MKKRSVRLAALGLSAIFIASTVTFPVHASEASEESEGSVFASENTIEETTELSEETSTETSTETSDEDYSADSSAEESLSEEKHILEEIEVERTKEEIEETEETEEIEEIEEIEDEVVEVGEDSQETTGEDSEEIETTSQDFDFDEAQEVIAAAVEDTDDINQKSAEVAEQTEDAVTVLLGENTTADEAFIAIVDAEDSYYEALDEFDSAEESYETALEAYNQAINAYNSILDKYENEKAENEADIEAVETEISLCQNQIQELEQQLAEAQKELAEASANVVISNDSDETATESDIEQYIANVIEYYYIPETENLSEGERVSGFTIYEEDQADGQEHSYLTVEYSIVDENGQVLRTSNAQYRYEIVDGSIKVYTNEKQYHYTNKDGSVVSITKAEAEALAPDYQIEIDRYWTTSGRYVLRYVNNDVSYHLRYTGYDYDTYSNAKAISDGKSAIETIYNSPRKGDAYFNVAAEFKHGEGTDYISQHRIELNVVYDVYYDIEGHYGYVSDGLAARHFESEDAAKSAMLEELLSTTKGVYGIDFEASKDTLDLRENTVYSYIVTDCEEVELNSELTGKINAYYLLLNSYDNAKSQLEVATVRYNLLVQQANEIQDSYTGIIELSAVVATMEMQLEQAEYNYQQAADNLVRAEEALDKAYELYGERFAFSIGTNKPSNPEPEPEEPAEESVEEPEEPAEDPEEPEVILEEPAVEPEKPTEEPEVKVPQTKEPKEIENPKEEEIPTIVDEQEDIDNLIADITRPVFLSIPSNDGAYYQSNQEEEEEELEEEETQEIEDEDVPLAAPFIGNFGSSHNNYGISPKIIDEIVINPDAPVASASPETSEDEDERETITIAGLLKRGKWFVALGVVSTAGAGIAAVEAKRRAAVKLLDKLNQ